LAHTPQNPSSNDRIGGGGAATSAGIRFEQQLGGLFSSWILAGDRLHHSFRLGAATPEWVRFETEAPVDDLLVKTSDGGYIAVQAKTTASLSADPGSPLGKTISQFIRHWLVAQQGDGAMEWNRPLDPARDRLVLAVSQRATAQIKDDLPDALRLISQPGGGALNQAQRHAYRVFSLLVERAWASVTKSPFNDDLLLEVAKLVVIFVFDEDQGCALATSSLIKVFGAEVDTAAAFASLCDLSGKLMKERGGGDLQVWRQLLGSRGIVLKAPPEYLSDIEALKRHSKQVAEALSSYEKIVVGSGESLSVRRDCQTAIESAVRSGPLLIIGEPGAGKSGVLNALAQKLGDDGLDVLQLAVDRYSIESLEGLSREIGLKHPLLDVLEAWDGPGEAYLVVDALDATRGGRGENIFRTLIERVLERKGRWNVVASIRNFDLRMGQQLRALFRGTPPQGSLADPSFSNVSHVQIPSWSEAEFEQLLKQSPALATCLANSPPRLRDLAMVPFNTRLLIELISSSEVKGLHVVASQADLLRLYWEHRVEDHGSPATSSLHRVVQFMVKTRALRAPKSEVALDAPAMIDTLCREGVLVVVNNERWVQFRHHLLFDYAAARLYLDPDGISNNTYRFRKSDALGLMLSPALGFVLREVWESDCDHSRFWGALGNLINDKDGDPIIRSAAGRLGAEFPTMGTDCLHLGDAAIEGHPRASETLSHVTGALAVRLEDEKEVVLEPWVFLAHRLATEPSNVVSTLRFLLHNLIGRSDDDAFKPMLGQAARALLAYGLSQNEPGFIVRTAIDFVIATYDSDIAASRSLIAQIFHHNRLVHFGHEEVPAVCYKIEAIGKVDPDFVATVIYRTVFDYQVTEEHQTKITHSQILNLTSNARQDYGMARWSLGEYLPRFLLLNPRAAVKAVVNSLEGYVAREHAISEGGLNIELCVGGRSIHLREDHSYIWAHDPDSTHDRDAELLVAKLRERLKDATEPEAMALIDMLIDEASLAIFWSRMFLSAVERSDDLVNLLWPIAVTEPFLILPDTRKDAIDLVVKGYSQRTTEERQAFEESVHDFDFSKFTHQAEARRAFMERLFVALGRENLVTGEARRILDTSAPRQIATNERLFKINSGWSTPEDFFWMRDLDQNVPENSSLIYALKAAEGLLGLDSRSDDVALVSLGDSLAALKSVTSLIDSDAVHVSLKRHAEGIIGKGCQTIVARKLLVSKEAPPTAEQDAEFLTLLEVAARSESPELEPETEENFEQSAAWGSPAARVEAAQAYWDLLAERADLYPELGAKAEEMLSDPHPAVRLSSSARLVRIWDIDRDRFWQLLDGFLTNETNLTIIEHLLGGVISRLIHADQHRSLALLMMLSHRETSETDRQRRLHTAIADNLTILWVTYKSTGAKAVIDQWIREPWKHQGATSAILATLRDAVVAGIADTPDKHTSIRQRSQMLISDIVNAANTRLAKYFMVPDLNGMESEEVRECARLIDTAGMQLFFATDEDRNQQSHRVSNSRAGLQVFLRENADLIKRIGEYAQPHTTYYLLQLVERLVDVDAGTAFDLAMSILQSSTRSNYKNDSLGVDLLVKLVGVFLADHKEIFEDSVRRTALIDSLEIFMDAGWPAARRLLYRLPEFIQ
jgi:hypothetical protein